MIKWVETWPDRAEAEDLSGTTQRLLLKPGSSGRQFRNVPGLSGLGPKFWPVFVCAGILGCLCLYFAFRLLLSTSYPKPGIPLSHTLYVDSRYPFEAEIFGLHDGDRVLRVNGGNVSDRVEFGSALSDQVTQPHRIDIERDVESSEATTQTLSLFWYEVPRRPDLSIDESLLLRKIRVLEEEIEVPRIEGRVALINGKLISDESDVAPALSQVRGSRLAWGR